ncbi:hypothetical protein HS088_TW06G00270 [Tripterygium wilfordii]|uniref:Uncharacterized protein n=1 Tax=Tripterygium wilfordii TaxID=458696 RepID=A0A7J7DIB3_TRIWF|nr:uncharacterized protein LOC120000217 [Tripterygium wilfordii]KAF5746105.1 hypothetical protein HS088_TW06G00270 [Tripterygium wilfordii]
MAVAKRVASFFHCGSQQLLSNRRVTASRIHNILNQPSHPLIKSLHGSPQAKVLGDEVNEVKAAYAELHSEIKQFRKQRTEDYWKNAGRVFAKRFKYLILGYLVYKVGGIVKQT